MSYHYRLRKRYELSFLKEKPIQKEREENDSQGSTSFFFFFFANHQGSTSCPEEVVELSLIPKLKVAERYNAMHNRPCMKHDIPPMD